MGIAVPRLLALSACVLSRAHSKVQPPEIRDGPRARVCLGPRIIANNGLFAPHQPYTAAERRILGRHCSDKLVTKAPKAGVHLHARRFSLPKAIRRADAPQTDVGSQERVVLRSCAHMCDVPKAVLPTEVCMRYM